METSVVFRPALPPNRCPTAVTRQIATRYADATRVRLVTELVERPLRPLRPGEILVEVLVVPIHGSFWLATHPDGLHPRKEELLSNGHFVFGNGGVGRVVATTDAGADVQVGDVVAIFGHVPCAHPDCHACTVEHRYAECGYGESAILGHGPAFDGTYSQYVVLPPHSYEVAFRAGDKPGARAMRALAFAFLVADVRNALTRSPDTLSKERVLLVGAGLSGRIAAHLLLRATPGARFVVVDVSEAHALEVKALRPDAIEVVVPGAGLGAAIGGIADAARRHFGGAPCNLVFDASSGDSAPLWTNARVLSPGTECIQFGFGSTRLNLDRDVIQVSGLTFRTTRGVGTVANRREVVDLLKSDDASFVDRFLFAGSTRLGSLEAAITFIRTQQEPPRAFQEIPRAHIELGAAPFLNSSEPERDPASSC